MRRNHRIEAKKAILESASEKFGLKPHCVMDEVQLYLRYIMDKLFPDHDDDSDLAKELVSLYYDFRTSYATDSYQWAKIHMITPSVTAACLFYAAAKIVGIESAFVRQQEICDVVLISPATMQNKWKRIIEILRPNFGNY